MWGVFLRVNLVARVYHSHLDVRKTDQEIGSFRERMMADIFPQKEFDSVLQSRNVVAKLNELETLVGEAERRRDAAGVAEAPIP